MTSNPSSQGYERLQIGKYAISKSGDSFFWIGIEGGEGMRISKVKLEEFIDDFYEREF